MAEDINQEVVTEQGYKEMQEELNRLQNEERASVIEKLRIARSFGDLSENAEYEEAKNEQSILEGKIRDLEKRLKNVKVIKNDQISTGTVSVGTTVKLLNLDNDQEVEYMIVGPAESNVREGKLSNDSPVGRGLLNKAVGEVVTITVPMGVTKYKILNIRR